MSDWQKAAGLNVETAVKRAVFTIHEKLALKKVGVLADTDAEALEKALREWLDLP